MKNKENLFILIGPTAIGKTELSIDLGKRMNGEIISADSMQIYKYMDIGSAKVTKEEMAGVEHHLIDILYPDEEFTVSNYKDRATDLISAINQTNKLPIVAGGTGLYINSLVYNLNFAEVAPNDNIRSRWESLANEKGNQFIHNELAKIDNHSSERISPNDRKRIIRALEIYETTGKTMSEYNKNFRIPIEDYNLVMIGLNMDRAKLYDRINRRVDIMIEDGLIEEVRNLVSRGYTKDLVSMKGIGYKEIILYLDDILSLEESIELIKRKTRNYAKRQLTWFRGDSRIRWMNIDDYPDTKTLGQKIIEYTKDKIIST